ncbi:MAG: hypothetical protein FWG43_03980, partial [Clostridiales bacterium]|nr:hypothetical protein [Clostridiales bacterium]
DLNFTMAESSVAYDTDLLEYLGYENASGWLNQVYREEPNLISMRNLPNSNLNVGAPCTDPLRLLTLKFAVKDTLGAGEVETDLSFAAVNVYPTADISDATTAPGENLTLSFNPTTMIGFISDYYGAGYSRRIVLDGNEELRASTSPLARRGLYLYRWVDDAIEVTNPPLASEVNGYDIEQVDAAAKAVFGEHGSAVEGLVIDYATNAIKVNDTTCHTDYAYIYNMKEHEEVYNSRELADMFVLVVMDGNNAQYILAFDKNWINPATVL